MRLGDVEAKMIFRMRVCYHELMDSSYRSFTPPPKPRHLLRQLLPLVFVMVVIILGTLNFKTIRLFLIGALGENANIVVDTQSDLGPMLYPWRNLAQGGENKDWRLQPLVSQVKALNTQYIRLDHIYDFYDIVKGGPGNLSFDFSKLDLVIRDILAAGAKPYIALSYMPPAFAVNGDITAPPANWVDWQVTVQRTIEHISGSMGIEGVYYEVWNEPDLFGGYKTYGSRNYLDLYRYAARGAQNARNVKAYRFGGPAITALYKNWVDGILTMVTNENLPLDFFSWHRYSREIDQYRKDIAQVREWLAPYPRGQNLELQITEWGHDPKIDPGYDSAYGAAHTIAVATELVGNIDRAFVFEIQDGKDPAGNTRWGRWGIFDINNQPKPRYNALRFLDKIGGTRVQLLGRGTWVKGLAGKDGADTTVILANFDNFGRHNEITPVTFTNIAPGNYQIERQTLSGAVTRTQVATTEAQLKVDVPMSANTAVFIRLHPL